MTVPEPPSMGTTGSLLMEQIPRVRESLTRGRNWAELADKAASGVFSTYDDAKDPDVKSVAALFAGGEAEDWADDQSDALTQQIYKPLTAAKTVPRGSKYPGGGGQEGVGEEGLGGRKEAPASSVHA